MATTINIIATPIETLVIAHIGAMIFASALASFTDKLIPESAMRKGESTISTPDLKEGE
jgi:hypothetical protein